MSTWAGWISQQKKTTLIAIRVIKYWQKNDRQAEEEIREYGYPAPYRGWAYGKQYSLDNTGFL
jgi:hypothetical protein